MTIKEADNIAWRLYSIVEATLATGPDCAMVIANAAIDAVDRIKEEHPKIAHEFEQYMLKPNRD